MSCDVFENDMNIVTLPDISGITYYNTKNQ